MLQNQPPQFGQKINSIKKAQGRFGITFHNNIILIMDFCTFKVDAHKTLRTKCLTTFIFFGGTK
jgi:hypothetical protein